LLDREGFAEGEDAVDDLPGGVVARIEPASVAGMVEHSINTAAERGRIDGFDLGDGRRGRPRATAGRGEEQEGCDRSQPSGGTLGGFSWKWVNHGGLSCVSSGWAESAAKRARKAGSQAFFRPP